MSKLSGRMGHMGRMGLIGLIGPICLIGLMTVTSHAQLRSGQGWAWQNPLPQGNPLNAIHFAKDKLSGFAVGNDNTILRTQDGGFTWQRQSLPLDLTISSVYVRNKETAVVVGPRGAIYFTDDGGRHWLPAKTDAKDHLYSVTFAQRIGWATGTYGRILKSIDGGESWTSQPAGTDEHLAKVTALDNQTAAVGGMNGAVLTTLDGGTTWKHSKPCGGARISGIAFLSAKSVFVVGYAGCVARSDDSGETWARINTFSRSDIGNCLSIREICLRSRICRLRRTIG